MIKRFMQSAILAMMGMLLFCGVASATWQFIFPITVADTSGVTRAYYPVMLGFGGQSLVDSAKISESGKNTNMQIGGANISYMMSTTNVTAVIPTLPAGGLVNTSLYTGFSPEQAGFPIIVGDSGNVTVSDNATIEPGDNFTYQATGWINTDAGVDKNLILKPEAFRTFVSNTVAENITAAISSVGNQTEIRRPDGNSICVLPNEVGVACPNHWQNVDEAVPNDADSVGILAAADNKTDVYTLANTAIPGTATIISVTATIRGENNATNGEFRVGLRIGADTTWGTIRTDAAWTTHTEALTRPGGGNWLVSDLNALLYAVNVYTPGGADSGFVSWCYITVHYVDWDVSVTATGVSSGEHKVEVTLERDSVSNWWGTDWGARQKITLNNAASSENLTNFPVLVHLTTGNFSFSQAQTNGEDIRFVDSDNTTELDFEFERWVVATEAWCWVEVPQIDAGSATDYIWIYYNNPFASDGQDVAGTWNTNYKLVQHLQEDPSGVAPQMIDSTSYGNNGTNYLDHMTSGDQVLGQVDGSLDFDGLNNRIDWVDSAQWEFGTGNFTVSAWVKTSDSGGGILSSYQGGNVNDAIRLVIQADNATLSVLGDGNWGTSITSGPWTDNAWHQIYGVRASNMLTMYVDSVLQPATVANNINIDNSQQNLRTPWDASTFFLEGLIDEVRISNVARSGDWIKAAYLSGTDNFTTFGGQELNRLSFYIDDVLVDFGSGANIPDNSENWIFMAGNSMPYADNITLSVNGTQHLYFAPTAMLVGATIPDRGAGVDNPGTINWGSNTNVNISYGALESYESYIASIAMLGGFDMPAATLPSTWFASGENLANLPFYDAFSKVAAETGRPVQMIYATGIIGLAFGAFLMAVMFTRSALLAWAAMVMVLIIGSSQTIIPWWIPFTVIISGLSIMYLYRQVA